MNFREYQQKQKYSEKSIRKHEHHLKHFQDWCMVNNKDYQDIGYNNLLEYVKYQKSKKVKDPSINNSLNCISIYYDYLISIGKLEYNTARDVRIRCNEKKVLQDILTTKQLDDIYNDFAKQPQWSFGNEKIKLLHKRNQVILSLMIYQGLVVGELEKLEVNHVNLNECKIYIPSSRRSASRTLKLQAVQVIPMQEYIREVRPELLQKRAIETEKLFYDKKFADLICRIIKEAKGLNPMVESSNQIRSSVIMNWLKQYNIRQVQYMAGHRSIGSTERYRKEDLQDLSNQLAKYHPLQ
jgi:site-specific recombinase XerD